MQIRHIWFWFIFSTLLTACGDSAEKPESTLRVDEAVESLPVIPLRFQRFDSDLFSMTKESFTQDTMRLYKKYGAFFDLYASKVIRVGNKKLPLFRENLLGFIQDPDIKAVKAEADVQYALTDTIQTELTDAFNRYHKAFPDSAIPAIYTIISGFNYNIVVEDSTLAIGLDMYLGKSCKFYEWLALPQYKVSKMNRQMLVPDAVRGWILSNFELKSQREDLIEFMIYQGKVMYLSQQFLPERTEANVLGYSDDEQAWCMKNEAKIWSHFIDKKLFFSNDFNDQLIYINDGPFTKGFPQEAPSRIGVWLGFQIVKSYMNKFKDVTLPELMQEQDAHKIFNAPGYKPGRV